MTNPQPTNSSDFDPLEAMQADWQQTKPEKDGEFTDLPDGTYVAKVKDTRLGSSERSAAYTFGIIFKFLSPKVANREKGKFVVLVDKDGNKKPENLPRLMSDLETLGLKITQLRELRARREEIHGKLAVVTLKMNSGKTYQNVYIERLATADDIKGVGVPTVTAGGSTGAGAPAESTNNEGEATPF